MRFYRQNQKQAYLFRNSPLNMDRVHFLYVCLLFFRVLFCFAFHVEWKKIMWSVLETCDSELPPLASRVSVFLCIQWKLICGCWWCDARCIPIFLISEGIDNRNCLNFTMVTLNCQYIGWKIAVHFRKKNITKKVEYTKKKRRVEYPLQIWPWTSFSSCSCKVLLVVISHVVYIWSIDCAWKYHSIPFALIILIPVA